MAGAFGTAPQLEGAFQLRLRLGIEPQITVCVADGLTDRSLHHGLPVKLAGETGRGPVQGGPHLEVRIGLGVRPSLSAGTRLRQNVILQEVVHRLCHSFRRRGPIALAQRGLLGLPGAGRLPGADQDAREQNREHGHHSPHQRLVAAGELLQLIGGTRWPGRNRLIPEIALKVAC